MATVQYGTNREDRLEQVTEATRGVIEQGRTDDPLSTKGDKSAAASTPAPPRAAE